MMFKGGRRNGASQEQARNDQMNNESIVFWLSLKQPAKQNWTQNAADFAKCPGDGETSGSAERREALGNVNITKQSLLS